MAESGKTCGQALREVLELIARRQLLAWTDWRPWVALVGLVAPLGMVLSIVSRSWATGGGIYAWFYVNNWTWGARRDLAHAIEGVCIQYLALIVWSWTTGFALGSVSRGTVWVSGAVFCVVLFGGTLGSTTAGMLNPGNAAVFSLAVYRVALPVIVRTVLIVLPAVWGMWRASRAIMLRLPQAIGWALVAITLAALNATRLQVSVLFGW